jgi:hypothetical protein
VYLILIGIQRLFQLSDSIFFLDDRGLDIFNEHLETFMLCIRKRFFWLLLNLIIWEWWVPTKITNIGTYLEPWNSLRPFPPMIRYGYVSELVDLSCCVPRSAQLWKRDLIRNMISLYLSLLGLDPSYLIYPYIWCLYICFSFEVSVRTTLNFVEEGVDKSILYYLWWCRYLPIIVHRIWIFFTITMPFRATMMMLVLTLFPNNDAGVVPPL